MLSRGCTAAALTRPHYPIENRGSAGRSCAVCHNLHSAGDLHYQCRSSVQVPHTLAVLLSIFKTAKAKAKANRHQQKSDDTMAGSHGGSSNARTTRPKPRASLRLCDRNFDTRRLEVIQNSAGAPRKAFESVMTIRQSLQNPNGPFGGGAAL